MASRDLLRRRDANRDQRRVGRAGRGAAGSASFGQELRRISGRPAIGRDQNFVVLALRPCSRSTRSPISTTRTLGLGGPAGPAGPRTGRAGRTDGTSRTGIALGTLRPRRTGIALRAFPAAPTRPASNATASDQMRCTHFQILPKKPDPRRPAKKIKLGWPRKDDAKLRCRMQTATERTIDQFTAVHVPSGLRQAVPRWVCGVPSI